MKYLYTTEPDEGCHKINGVYGRPVHTSEQSKLKAKGWKENPNELRKEEGREEEKEVAKHFEFTVNDNSEDAKCWVKKSQSDDRDVWADLYEEKFGKRPHHKAKLETIKAKVDEALKDD